MSAFAPPLAGEPTSNVPDPTPRFGDRGLIRRAISPPDGQITEWSVQPYLKKYSGFPNADIAVQAHRE
jgi:hypothetical protein